MYDFTDTTVMSTSVTYNCKLFGQQQVWYLQYTYIYIITHTCIKGQHNSKERLEHVFS